MDLLRIATGGSGILPAGEIHPDLVERLAREASKTAGYFLHMCIRALDYCPPVDVDFGDYLRALITADADLVSDDSLGYRLALIDAFRRRGIYPHDVRSLSTESLVWQSPGEDAQKAFLTVFGGPAQIRNLVLDWGLTTNRQKIFEQGERSQGILHSWFTAPGAMEAAKSAQLVLDSTAPKSFYSGKDGIPTLEVHSVRPTRRIGPDNQTITDLVVEMTQRRRGYLDPQIQDQVDRGEIAPPRPDFIFRGGCTLLVDPETAKVRYCIYKRIMSTARIERMRQQVGGDSSPSLRATYLGDPRGTYFKRLLSSMRDQRGEAQIEPFALLHRSYESEEVL